VGWEKDRYTEAPVMQITGNFLHKLVESSNIPSKIHGILCAESVTICMQYHPLDEIHTMSIKARELLMHISKLGNN
jgi:hypothetical protein